jgi:PhnB protein
MVSHIRHGVGAVRPYLFGHVDLPSFVCGVFEGIELERLTSGNGAHVEVRIGDSVVVIEAGDPPHAAALPASVYVYVSDVDATYARALARGARSLDAPSDKPYDERTAGIVDPSGNTWWFATYRAPK